MIYADVKALFFNCFDCGTHFKHVQACPMCQSTNAGVVALSENQPAIEIDWTGKAQPGFGAIIKAARLKANISQRKLGEMISRTRWVIGDYEAETAIPIANNLTTLANALNIKLISKGGAIP